MRILTDHIVSGDSPDNQLSITVIDEPGAGGANHRYEITGFDMAGNPSFQGDGSRTNALILFQNGTIREVGVNGVTQEALLAIVIDRLKSFQAGPFACQANAKALTCVMDALDQLQARTRDRIARGVEGLNKS